MNARGRVAEARRCFEKALEEQADNRQALLWIGYTDLLRGEYQEAAQCFRQVLSMEPRNATALSNLGSALLSLGNSEEAIECLQQALQLLPQSAEVHASLAMAMQHRGDLVRAEHHSNRAVQLAPRNVEIRYQRVRVLVGMGRLEDAIACCETALQIDPNSLNVLVAKATIHDHQRQYETAYGLIRRVLNEDGSNLEAALVLASLAKRFGIQNEAIARLESLLEQNSLPSMNQARVHTALGKLHDQMGNYDAAFHHLQQSKRGKDQNFDPAQNKQFIQAIIQTFSAAALIELPVAKASSKGLVFIVGMPRSGTTLVEQILASHPEVHAAGESTSVEYSIRSIPSLLGAYGNYPEFISALTTEVLDLLATEFLGTLRTLSAEASCITVNERGNELYLGLIELLFPEARIVHCLRDPRDTCLSCYFQDFTASLAYTGDLRNLGLHYRAYERLMEHWKSVLQLPVMEVKYEELVANPEPAMRALIEFCGLEWDDRCLRFHESDRPVTTPSYDQVRRPVYGSSVGRWRNYRAQLQPLFSALEEEEQ